MSSKTRHPATGVADVADRALPLDAIAHGYAERARRVAARHVATCEQEVRSTI
jgi:hypothetical protein